MGVYTDSNGNTYNINIDGGDLQMLQNNPDFHFCWMSENSQIYDIHSDYYEDRTEDNEIHRVFKKQLTVKTASGDSVTGRMYHWVRGPCSGTDLEDWFIICTKPYPYIRDRKEAWG